MSERERWIVYPLLLLTLAIALRDTFVAPKDIRAHRMTCEEMVVVKNVENTSGAAQVVLESTNAGGVVRAINADSTMELVLGHEEHASSLFREIATTGGTKTRAVLGNLRPAPPHGVLDWMGVWPLLDPRLNRAGQPAASADTSGDEPADSGPGDSGAAADKKASAK